MPFITSERESFCDSLTFDRHTYLRQLLLVELVEHQLDQADGAEQIAAALRSILGGDCCILCMEEPPLIQFTHILVDGILPHPQLFCQ